MEFVKFDISTDRSKRASNGASARREGARPQMLAGKRLPRHATRHAACAAKATFFWRTALAAGG
jgi:hypothetical protein